jgi:tetratricopeptide (TPR) repeat protein
MDRVATFRTFIAKSPADPFPLYGLAMELKGQGDLGEAWTVFADLLDRFPDYVPTYLQAGATLAALGRGNEAASTYRRGIEAAAARGDSHARQELESALTQIGARQ